MGGSAINPAKIRTGSDACICTNTSLWLEMLLSNEQAPFRGECGTDHRGGDPT